MKIVLLQPPVEDFHDAGMALQPLGLCYLKAAVRRRHPDVEVLVRDFRHGWGRKSIPLPTDLRYLAHYLHRSEQSPFSLPGRYYRFGASDEEIAACIACDAPDLVGISIPFSPYYREALRCAEEIKRLASVPIVMGGPHVSAAPMSVLKHECVDYVIRGGGERPLVELVSLLKSGLPPERGLQDIPGLGYRRDGRPVLNPLDGNYPFGELPVPDVSDLEPERYLLDGLPCCLVTASRGCPNGCAFCAVRRTFARYSRRQPEDVLEEVRLRYEQGYRAFAFADDNLAHDPAWTKHLCRLLADAFPGGDVRLLSLGCVCHARLDSELLELMRQAGFTRLALSLIAQDPRVVDAIRRPRLSRPLPEVAAEASRLGFLTEARLILGLPGERLDSMIMALAQAARLPVLIHASAFFSAPGSPVAGNHPYHSDSDYFLARPSSLACETELASRDDVFSLLVASRIVNFLKTLPIASGEVSLAEALGMESASDLDGGQAGTAAIGREILRILFREGRLCRWSDADGPMTMERFRMELLARFLMQAGHVSTLAGGRIDVAGPLPASPNGQR